MLRLPEDEILAKLRAMRDIHNLYDAPREDEILAQLQAMRDIHNPLWDETSPDLLLLRAFRIIVDCAAGDYSTDPTTFLRIAEVYEELGGYRLPMRTG